MKPCPFGIANEYLEMVIGEPLPERWAILIPVLEVEEILGYLWGLRAYIRCLSLKNLFLYG